MEQHGMTEEESSIIRDFEEEQSVTINILREDSLKIKEKLSLHSEFLSFKQDAHNVIHNLNKKVTDMHLQILQLHDKLTQLSLHTVQLETSKTKELDGLNHHWQEKLKERDSQTERTIQEIVKKHCEAKKNYEILILGLKEQIAHKEAEVAWCQLMVKEKDSNIDKEIANLKKEIELATLKNHELLQQQVVSCCQLMVKERDFNIDKEITNLKKELEVTTLKNQDLLQQRLVEVERRANRMTQKCLKLQQGYEQKMSLLKKEKDLQVEALKEQIMNQAERDMGHNSKLENAVKELELRYRRIVISLYTASQKQRAEVMKKIAEPQWSPTTAVNR